MKELLFLAHRIPYPPTKGDKIRSWNIFRHLARDRKIHLGCFVDDPEDLEHVSHITGMCESSRILRLHPGRAKIRSLAGLATGAPLSLPYFFDRTLAAWVDQTLAQRSISDIFVYSSPMAQYLLRRKETPPRLTVDFVDVDSEKWRQYAAARRGIGSWIYRREARTLFQFEKRVAAAAQNAVFVSEAEAALFRERAPDVSDRVSALINGVDTDYFDNNRHFDSPYPDQAPRAVFTGAMDYWANVDAVCWFVRDVMPLIRARIPDFEFWIVGSKPASPVKALAARDGVFVTGRVTDVRPYLSAANAAVAPMRIARGVQNKVLEAMAMSRPVVATPDALEGIDAAPGENVLCEDTAAGYADAVIALLSGPHANQIGESARKCVTKNYGWSAALGNLSGLLSPDANL